LRDFIDGLAEGGDTPAMLAMLGEGVDQWSYTALSALVAELANGLTGRGIGTGSHVALCAAHGPAWIIAALATIATGAVLVPVDPQSDARSLAHIVKDCGATLWFTSSLTERRLRERTAGEVTSILLDGPPEAENSWHAVRKSGLLPSPALVPEDTAVMFYTSGTTGMPKGVPLTHRNLLFQVETLRSYNLVAEGERILLALPLHHVYPFSIGLLGTFAFHGTMVIARALTGPEIIRALRDGAVTTIIGVPRLFEVFLSGMLQRVRSRSRAAFVALCAILTLNVHLRRLFGVRLGRRLFARAMQELGSPIRMVVSGGAALDAGLAAKLDALGWSVASGYGLTETAPLLTILLPGDRRFTTVGKPVSGIELRIAPVAAVFGGGEALILTKSSDDGKGARIGEIQVRGLGVFTGYRNLPDKSADAFTDDGWFRTEDLGFLDRRGYLHFLGRHSTLIVTGAGENVQPETLESEYTASPAIREIGVLQRGGALCAVVVPDDKAIRKAGATDVEQAVRAAVSEASKRLPSHHRLARYVISQDALPRTRLGKIRRVELVRRFDEIVSGQRGAAHRKPAPMLVEEMSDDDKALLDEPAARAVWDLLCDRYADRPLSPDASLAIDLGIDSLEWINVTLAIRQRCAAEITEEATTRIATVRDLLNEAVAAESGEVAEAMSLVFDDPQRFVSDVQRSWLRPLGRSEAWWARALYGVNKFAMQHLFRLEVVGRENLPRNGNFICAPNHMSVLDPFVVAAAVDFGRLRETYWAGWTGMAFANHLFCFVSRIAQVLPIEQDRAAFSSIAMSLIVLDEGKNLIWFPEGERSRDGRLHRFRTGIGLVLARRPIQTVPMLIDGTFEAMPTGRRFPRFKRLKILIGRPLAPDALEKAGRGSSREERIASGLHDVVEQLRQTESQ
jgi:long-chain acyl-CoA synthetase